MDLDPTKRYRTTLDMINALSRIDGSLDWEYVKHDSSNIEWIEINSETLAERKVQANFKNGSWSINAFKDNVLQKHLVKNNLQDSKLFTNLDSILHKTWKRLKK